MGITFLYCPFNITKLMDKCLNSKSYLCIVRYISIKRQHLSLCLYVRYLFAVEHNYFIYA
jgi:hypothetical protein